MSPYGPGTSAGHTRRLLFTREVDAVRFDALVGSWRTITQKKSGTLPTREEVVLAALAQVPERPDGGRD